MHQCLTISALMAGGLGAECDAWGGLLHRYRRSQVVRAVLQRRRPRADLSAMTVIETLAIIISSIGV
jgi:hypothetical protein